MTVGEGEVVGEESSASEWSKVNHVSRNMDAAFRKLEVACHKIANEYVTGYYGSNRRNLWCLNFCSL